MKGFKLAGLRTGSIKVKLLQQWENYGLPVLFVIIIIIFSVIAPSFRTQFNLINTFRFTSFIGISAIGMAFCIMSGEFDISIGSMLALVAVFGSSLIPMIGGVGGVLSAIAAASLLGFVNGIFVTKLKIPAFITTLGMLYIYRAIAYLYTNNTPVYIENNFWLFIGNGKVLGIPFAIILMAICYIVAFLLLRKSPFGRYIIAVGTNKNAAMLSGVNVDNMKIAIFTLVGFFVGISSVIISANLGCANPGLMGQGYEFQIITAVVLGGTLLGGGNGSLGGAFFASLILTYLGNGMGILQVDSYWQKIVTGLVLIFAVALYRMKYTVLGQKE